MTRAFWDARSGACAPFMFFPRHDLMAMPVLEPDELDRVADGEAGVDGSRLEMEQCGDGRLAI